MELCDPDTLVVYDISDLVRCGCYSADFQVARHAREVLTADYPANSRIVVLTEGSTDKQFLERSLGLLYPHLSEYFAFMDFEGMAVPGGAGALATRVKAFAGAGITNRVVALFDNDTAGIDAARQLTEIPLPSSYRVLTCPSLAIATAWPTLGPTGSFTMDVNGLAGSIELYFGEDVLRGEHGLEPVQWRGLVEGVGRYQGELVRKSELQQRFRTKLKRATHDPSALETLDWSGMRAILDKVRRAFE